VAALRRLAVSPFAEGGMRTFAEIETAAVGGPAALDALLLAPEAALEGWPSTHLGPAEAAKVAHGQAVAADPALPCGHVKVYAGSGRLVAIGLVTEERKLAPMRVFLR
jgi:tRNA U55 pseudouridine synthase TruB